MNSFDRILLVSIVCLAVACERPAKEQPAGAIETVATETTGAAETTGADRPRSEGDGGAESASLSHSAVEETARARATVIGAALPPEPTRTLDLPNAAAEGAMAQIWERDGQIQKVVFEFKGETYDRLHTIYFEGGEPLFGRFYQHFDPAKMLAPGDEGYEEAVEARTVEVVFVTYLPGDETKVESATIEVSTPASYDGGSLVEMRPLPATKPAKTG